MISRERTVETPSAEAPRRRARTTPSLLLSLADLWVAYGSVLVRLER
jgi:hypothetical protein